MVGGLLLREGYPTTYQGYRLHTDYTNMLKVDMAFSDKKLPPYLQTVAVLRLLYAETPPDLHVALDGFYWFYSRGKYKSREEWDEAHKNEGKHRPAMDFVQDGSYILAGFSQTFGIELDKTPYMHWWKFCGLLEALPENTLFQRIIYWRKADTAKMSKDEREYVLKMRKIYGLKYDNPDKGKTIQQIEAELLAENERRFAEVKAATEAARQKGG